MFLALFTCFSNIAFCQKVDTVIHKDNYTSYYSYSLHDPLYVNYKLFHGGGDCSRNGRKFKTDGLPFSATPSDYAGNGYDEGHLADSKDFAYDCNLQEETFRFYNCVPQTPALNRGIWKHFETLIRKESQTDSLMIIAGSIFGSRTIGDDHVAVPDKCWKIVYSLSTGKVIHSLIFPNDESHTYQEIEIADLKKLIPYTIISLH